MIVIRFSSWSTTLYLPSPIFKKKVLKQTHKEVMNQGLSFHAKYRHIKWSCKNGGKKFSIVINRSW